jgi:hypothetical protein
LKAEGTPPDVALSIQVREETELETSEPGTGRLYKQDLAAISARTKWRKSALLEKGRFNAAAPAAWEATLVQCSCKSSVES